MNNLTEVEVLRLQLAKARLDLAYQAFELVKGQIAAAHGLSAGDDMNMDTGVITRKATPRDPP